MFFKRILVEHESASLCFQSTWNEWERLPSRPKEKFNYRLYLDLFRFRDRTCFLVSSLSTASRLAIWIPQSRAETRATDPYRSRRQKSLDPLTNVPVDDASWNRVHFTVQRADCNLFHVSTRTCHLSTARIAGFLHFRKKRPESVSTCFLSRVTVIPTLKSPRLDCWSRW